MDDVAEAIMALKRAGWSIGDAAFVGELGELVWIVSGHNGENRIRAEGTTQDETWQRAVEQAQGSWHARTRGSFFQDKEDVMIAI